MTLTGRSELVFRQQFANSSTHGPASFPSTSKIVPAGLACVVIFNMGFKDAASDGVPVQNNDKDSLEFVSIF
jgi:hypothetical protein